jgi:predicted RNA polymerase sigma factor
MMDVGRAFVRSLEVIGKPVAKLQRSSVYRVPRLSGVGKTDDARAAYPQARVMAKQERKQRFLERRLGELN